MIGDYPYLRIPLVAAYQRMFSVIPSNNYEKTELLVCLPGYFFGFHDKCPWSYDNSRLLAHRFDIEKSDSQLENDSIEVGYFENDEFDKYRVIGSTRAWNWQQGSSLQWVGRTGKIIYNDVEQGKCVAKIYDPDESLHETMPYHIMAVSNNGRYALSCSFSRLGKGMPGYGYSQQLVDNANDLLPDNEGLSIVDLENHDIKRIISLKVIVQIAPHNYMDGAYHFFTHCLFSPNNKRFIFFHRYLRKNGTLETRMFSSDLEGWNIWHFAGEKFSHIAWFNDTNVLAYCQPPGREIGFYYLEEFTNKVTSVANEYLTSDGHPQVTTDGKYILVDTYPDRFRNQHLLIYDIDNKHCELLLKYKIPFKYRLERRCDFHPRWNRDNTMICFDSAHKNVRSLCVMRNPLCTGSSLALKTEGPSEPLNITLTKY